MPLKNWVKLQHKITDLRAAAFIGGFCMAILLYCLFYTFWLFMSHIK